MPTIKNLIPTSGTHTIDKDLATAILNTADNSLNREINDKRVKQYANDMTNGNWHNNFDPIKISVEGHIYDGQHRLTAIAVSDTEQEIYFILDVPTETDNGVKMFETFDLLTRKPYEILQIHDKTLQHPKEIVSLMRHLAMFNRKLSATKVALSSGSLRADNILELANEYVPLSVLDGNCNRGLTLYTRSKRVNKDVWSLLVATLGTIEGGNTFLEDLADLDLDDGIVYDREGGELASNTPLGNLIHLLEKAKNPKDIFKLTTKDSVIQVFNAFNRGNKVVAKNTKLSPKELHYPKAYKGYVDSEL